jgi:hypothetical protein
MVTLLMGMKLQKHVKISRPCRTKLVRAAVAERAGSAFQRMGVFARAIAAVLIGTGLERRIETRRPSDLCSGNANDC